MDHKQTIKTRPQVADAKGEVVAFFESLKRLYITCNDGSAFPPIEFAEYRYAQGEQYLILTPMSIFKGVITDGMAISAVAMVGDSPKMSQKFYAHFTCEAVEVAQCALATLAETDKFIGHMKGHGAQFFRLNMEKGTLVLNPGQMYDLDAALTPSFARYSPNGKERFEHSRHVLMTYLDREVLFNTIVEGDVYYTLTRSDSNKMEHIKNGGICEIYDGAGVHFSTTMEVLEDTTEVFEKLNATNNAFFKENENLTALRFQKQ